MFEFFGHVSEYLAHFNDLVHPVQPILSFVASIFGLGTFAFIALLHWALKTLRDQMKAREGELKDEKRGRLEAEKSRDTAVQLAEERAKEPGRLRRENEELKGIINRSHDDARQRAAELGEEVDALRAKLDSPLNITAYPQSKSEDAIGFWSRSALKWESYTEQLASSIPILFFGSQKGGVGKTMTATNLAACFAARGEKVLIVDLDYQGSSSAMLRLEAQKGKILVDDIRKSRIDYVFQTPPLTENWIELTIRHVTSRLHYIESYYDFEELERSLEYRWSLCEFEDDVRYRLARALLSPVIQTSYDRIILDAPPRFTIGFVNGICAATHVFVPTLLDQVSAAGVDYFSQRFKKLAPKINPALRINGVIGTINNGNAQYTLPQALHRNANLIDARLQNNLGVGGGLFIREAVITRKAEIASGAESGIPYSISESVRPMYDKLADVINRCAPRRQNNASKAA
jgi:cellulose biosynthesis protein BcsQ